MQFSTNMWFDSVVKLVKELPRDKLYKIIKTPEDIIVNTLIQYYYRH